ncbi:hypothetical protein A5662_07680 [Mycobacteriaceae bacterium 1482268.1]|nr:hypothetical protein A5662_07680 [Mycobacteriaceae bacterium 1482268.1]
MSPHHEDPSATRPPPAPVKTLSDEDTMKEVIDPGRQIIQVAGLQEVSGGFDFEACNDQGEPPYRGRLDMGFAIPKDVEPKKYIEQIAQTMVNQGVGWYDGPPAGKRLFGTVIHTDTVFAVISQHPVAKEDGAVRIFGECRNMVDHRNDATTGVDVTDRLLSGS